MKTLFISLLILLSVASVKAQSTTADSTADKIFIAVEKDAEFPGGMDEFYKFIGNNIRYPVDAAKKKLQGKVFVAFIVEKDGKLTGIKITRGVSPDIDTEALRVVNLSPRWKMAIQNGRPVREQFNILITFKLPASIANPNLSNDTSHLSIVFAVIDHQPEFKGGLDALFRYLQKNIHYPPNAWRNNIQGKVFVAFTVEEDGSLTNIKVLRGVSEDIDAEALRVVKKSPKWIPGMKNNQPVRANYLLPISFSLIK